MSFNCPICSDHLNRAPADPTNTDGSKISCAPCGHIFHAFCIGKWLEGTLATSTQCPCCRKPIKGKKCLPLFPTVHDDSLAEDPDDASCNHGPILDDLRVKVATLERSIREKDIVHKRTVDDLNERTSELRQERTRSSEILIKYTEAKSYRTYAEELDQKNKVLKFELDTLKKYGDLIESIREGKEASDFDYPVTKESINMLKDLQLTLNRELLASHNKNKEAEKKFYAERKRGEDARREVERLKADKERLEDTIEHLKIELDEVRRENLNNAISETPEVTPKRKRVSTGDTSNVMILSSPDVDEDVMILQPLHKRKEKKPKSTSQGCSSTNLNSRFQKEVTSSSTCPEQSSSQNSNEDDSDFLYKGLSKKLSKRRIIGEGPGTSGLKNKKEASLSSDPLTPQGFTKNLKSSYPGLSRTPSGTFLNTKNFNKDLVPKPPKVLKKK